jgi:hypothetical protein
MVIGEEGRVAEAEAEAESDTATSTMTAITRETREERVSE